MHYILTPHVLQDQALGLEAYPLAIVLLATSILNEVCRLLMEYAVALLISVALCVGTTAMVIKGYLRLRRG